MKCTACGLPLSPSRNNGSCPRCGTPVSVAMKSTGGSGNVEPMGWSGSAGAQDRQWGQAGPFSAFSSSMAQTQAPQAGQMWAAGPNGMQGPGSFSPVPPGPRRPPRNSRIGFMVAGICVVTGGILLVLVYFLAIGQSGSTSTTGGKTPTTTAATSSPAVTPSPAGSPSPTATSFPGQRYINSAQMSSAQPSASQSAVPATTFKVQQTFYVVFTIKSGGQAGAVCLSWYLNGKPAFNFSFAVGANSTASYGQAMFNSPGSGYVELYWASSKACTDQVLAQHVDFTITT